MKLKLIKGDISLYPQQVVDIITLAFSAFQLEEDSLYFLFGVKVVFEVLIWVLKNLLADLLEGNLHFSPFLRSG